MFSYLLFLVSSELIIMGQPVRSPLLLLARNFTVFKRSLVVISAWCLYMLIGNVFSMIDIANFNLGDLRFRNLLVLGIIATGAIMLADATRPNLSGKNVVFLMLFLVAVGVLQPFVDDSFLKQVYAWKPEKVKGLSTGFSSEPSFYSFYVVWLLSAYMCFRGSVNRITGTDVIVFSVLCTFGFVQAFAGSVTTFVAILFVLVIVCVLFYLNVSPVISVVVYISGYIAIGASSTFTGLYIDQFTYESFQSWRELSFFSAIRGAELISFSFGNWEEPIAKGLPPSIRSTVSEWLVSPWALFTMLVCEFGILPAIFAVWGLWSLYFVQSNRIGNIIQCFLFVLVVCIAPKWMVFLFLNPERIRAQ